MIITDKNVLLHPIIIISKATLNVSRTRIQENPTSHIANQLSIYLPTCILRYHVIYFNNNYMALQKSQSMIIYNVASFYLLELHRRFYMSHKY